jgi:hypothetical protein
MSTNPIQIQQGILARPGGPTAFAGGESSRGLVRILSPDQVAQREALQTSAQTIQNVDPVLELEIARHCRYRMTEQRNFRNMMGIGQRLIDALRTYKGQYDPVRLKEIQSFGGSKVFARITPAKCRGATSLLRDIYLGSERPWDVQPHPDPEVPQDINQAVQQLVAAELAQQQQGAQQAVQQQAMQYQQQAAVAAQQGIQAPPFQPQPPQGPTPDQIEERVSQLMDAAKKAARKKAQDDAGKAADEIDTLLEEGGFYDALAEFLIDLPIFPFAAIKGPTVRMISQVKWVNGQPQRQSVPKMMFTRVSPFDLYWTPTAHNVHEAEFIERLRLTRADLLACKGLPGFNSDAITQVLDRFHDKGFREWWDVVDVERALLENREAWPRTSSSLIDTAEYHGSVSGKSLLEWGMDEAQIQDPQTEYRVTAWLIDRFVIKVQLDPTPSQRPPYYISQFEKIPGTMYGYGLPDLLDDVQQVANATMRSLVNNMGIASGPQVVINDQVCQPGENDDLYPWKRWHVRFDPMNGANQEPVKFYQPDSRASELQTIYGNLNVQADEVSSIPRYMTGDQKVGGAGRTASGLSMLMANAAKTLQNVAAGIDRDVMEPLLDHLYEVIMLTMPGVFRGDETILVKGVNYAVKREQDRTRQLEFLNMTNNPTDLGIVGVEGRANVLRSVSHAIGLDAEEVVPDEQQFEAQQQMQQKLQQATQQAQQAIGLAQQALKIAQGMEPPGQRVDELAMAAENLASQIGGQAGPPGGAPPGGPGGNVPAPGKPQTMAQETGVAKHHQNSETGRPGMRAGG